MPTCEEKVPQSPDAYLSSLLDQFRDSAQLSKQGIKLGGRVHLVGEICSAISEYWEADEDMTPTASDLGWPLEINFKIIPHQIMNLKNEISGIVANEFVLDNSLAWKGFLSHLKCTNCNLADFHGISNWGKFHAVGTNAHAG